MKESPVVVTSTKSTFRLACEAKAVIQASRQKIWDLLTNTADFTKWNTTILGAEGKIALGETIKIKSTLDPSRTFKLKVVEFSPPSKMVWTDGVAPFFRCVRTFTLTERSDGATDFQRVDVYSGLLLPLVAGELPDFKTVFETLATELKTEAEKI